MRRSVQALSVNWASESLLAVLSKTGEMTVEVKLVASDSKKLSAACESMKPVLVKLDPAAESPKGIAEKTSEIPLFDEPDAGASRRGRTVYP